MCIGMKDTPCCGNSGAFSTLHPFAGYIGPPLVGKTKQYSEEAGVVGIRFAPGKGIGDKFTIRVPYRTFEDAG